MDGWVCVMRIKLQLQGQGLALERPSLIPLAGSSPWLGALERLTGL